MARAEVMHRNAVVRSGFLDEVSMFSLWFIREEDLEAGGSGCI